MIRDLFIIFFNFSFFLFFYIHFYFLAHFLCVYIDKYVKYSGNLALDIWTPSSMTSITISQEEELFFYSKEKTLWYVFCALGVEKALYSFAFFFFFFLLRRHGCICQQLQVEEEEEDEKDKIEVDSILNPKRSVWLRW